VPRIRREGLLEPLEEGAAVLAPADTQRMVPRCSMRSSGRTSSAAATSTSRSRGGRRRASAANVFHQRGSLAAAFRLLPLAIPNFEMLGIPESVHRLLDRTHGLVLVTGPTGSGKSTTQAAMSTTSTRPRPYHIITLEDPIEYVHKHQLSIVDQRQVGEDNPSFAEGLRSAYREDPDVILVGEMRDPGDDDGRGHPRRVRKRRPGHAAHSGRAPGSRPDHRQLPGCSAAADPHPAGQLPGGGHLPALMRAVGGGRVAAYEILVANTAIRSMIKEGRTDQIRSVLQTSLREGSQTLERSLNQLIAAGMISEEDARSQSVNPPEIRA